MADPDLMQQTLTSWSGADRGGSRFQPYRRYDAEPGNFSLSMGDGAIRGERFGKEMFQHANLPVHPLHTPDDDDAHQDDTDDNDSDTLQRIQKWLNQGEQGYNHN